MVRQVAQVYTNLPTDERARTAIFCNDSEPVGWFAPPKLTRAGEPTLLWNQFRSSKALIKFPSN
jgi:hypothetical protein